tara:strand:+ start:6882 stop:7811 length:930 start_codon:yes stop_codon:yes gene_type:complete
LKGKENKIVNYPVLSNIIRFLKSIKLPKMGGLSVFDLFKIYYVGIINGALTTRASSIAFNFFMAIFPFLLFIIILIPYIPISSFQSDFLEVLNNTLPPNTSDFFNKNIFENINNQTRGGLLSSVFLVSMLLMANGVSAVFSGFQNSYHKQINRNFFNQYLYAFGVSVILVFVLIITIIGLGFLEIYVFHPIYEKFNFSNDSYDLTLLNSIKFIFFISMVYLSIAILYFFGTKNNKTNFFSVGALMTTLLIIINSYLFGIYIENFPSYNQLYGSIGALLILLFYSWLNSIILLLGFELNVSLSRLRESCI